MREPFLVASVCSSVIRRAWSLLPWLVLGCVASGTEQAPVVPEAPRVEPGVVARSEPAAPVGPTCTWERVEPRRFAPLVPPPESAECRPTPSRKRQAELRKLVRKDWMWSWPEHAKLVVAHGCDRLGAALSTVVFDSSSGHGGSLELLRLDHRDDGDWDLTWIDYNARLGGPPPVEGDPWRAEAPGGSRLRRGVLPGARVDPMLQRAREVLALRVRELEPPPPPPGVMLGQTVGSSSRDFHVGVRLVDTSGQGVEHYFGGYESTDEQQGLRVVLDLAAAEVWTVLGDDALVDALPEVGPDDAAIRELLASSFWAARARNSEYGQWYVRERLFGLAASLGGPELVPALLEAVRAQAEESASEERSRVSAINVLAGITRFDVRYAASGEPRPVKAVAAEVLAACDGR